MLIIGSRFLQGDVYPALGAVKGVFAIIVGCDECDIIIIVVI